MGLEKDPPLFFSDSGVISPINYSFLRRRFCLSNVLGYETVKRMVDEDKIKSFLLVYEAVKTTINDRVGWRGYMRRVI